MQRVVRQIFDFHFSALVAWLVEIGAVAAIGSRTENDAREGAVLWL